MTPKNVFRIISAFILIILVILYDTGNISRNYADIVIFTCLIISFGNAYIQIKKI